MAPRMSQVKKQMLSVCKNELVGIYKHAIDAVRPETLVRNSISVERNNLIIRNPINVATEPLRFNLNESNVHIIGGGKCVLSMATGLANVISEASSRTNNVKFNFSHGCLSLPNGIRRFHDSDKSELLAKIGTKCLFGSENNLPDKDSIYASQVILDNITTASEHDKRAGQKSLFLVLLSGGGSACLTKPRYIDLEQKLSIIRQLVQKGADIIELNRVRRYFSDVKGGQLAAYIFQQNPLARIVTLVMSDVIGDSLEFIASGPTVLEKENDYFKSMSDVLEKYSIDNPISKEVHHGVRPILFAGSIVHNIIIGSNRLAVQASVEKAKEYGYMVHCVGNDLEGPTHKIVDKILKLSHELRGSKSIIIGAGEATVEKRPGERWGKGGRAQEMALDYLISRLSSQHDRNNSSIDYFLAGGTDGQDGPTDVAACLASLSELEGQSCSMNLETALEAKRSHNSNEYWNNNRPDWLIKTGLTGTNVMDIYLLAKVRS